MSVHRNRLSAQQYAFNMTKILADHLIIGVDEGNGEDYTCVSYFKTPGRLRKFFRRVKLDRSVWQYKLIKNELRR